jgi:hypothetical protein
MMRHAPNGFSEMRQKIADGYGDIDLDVPVDAWLGEHLMKYLIDSNEAISHNALPPIRMVDRSTIRLCLLEA